MITNKTIISDSTLIFSNNDLFLKNMYKPYETMYFQDVFVIPIGGARIYPLLPEIPGWNGKSIAGLGEVVSEYWGISQINQR